MVINNGIVITQVEINREIGIYLTGMNLKEYIQKCLDGELTFPTINGKQPYLLPDVTPIVSITMSCGEHIEYPHFEDLPIDSVPCPCGNPKHWFVFVKKEEINEV